MIGLKWISLWRFLLIPAKWQGGDSPAAAIERVEDDWLMPKMMPCMSPVTLIEVNHMKRPSNLREVLSRLKCIVYHESSMINDLDIHPVLVLLVVVTTATIDTSI